MKRRKRKRGITAGIIITTRNIVSIMTRTGISTIINGSTKRERTAAVIVTVMKVKAVIVRAAVRKRGNRRNIGDD